MTNTMTNAEVPVPVTEQLPVLFTAQDQQKLHEIHAAITAISEMFEKTLPALSNSPMGRMLGL